MKEGNKARSMVQSEPFQQLIRRKKRFLTPLLLFFAVFSFCLPLFVGLFPRLMSRPVPWTPLPWGWFYAFAQILLTWLLGWVYWRKAKSFDHLAKEVRQRRGL